jgi:hypothetical protein
MNDTYKIDADYAKFRSLVKRKIKYREILEIKRDLGPKKVSSVWRYFGSLHNKTNKCYLMFGRTKLNVESVSFAYNKHIFCQLILILFSAMPQTHRLAHFGSTWVQSTIFWLIQTM